MTMGGKTLLGEEKGWRISSSRPKKTAAAKGAVAAILSCVQMRLTESSQPN